MEPAMRMLVRQAETPGKLVDTPMQPYLATDISAIDLRKKLTPEHFTEIRAMLLEYKFIIFRDQELSRERLIELAQQFGVLNVHPLDQREDYPVIQPLRSGVDPKRGHDRAWTADSSWREEPPFAVFERSLELPPRGGDTVYTDAGAAYRGLSEDMKLVIDELDAVHSAAYAFDARIRFRDPGIAARIARDFPPVTHPVVRRHPETGEKLLYVNQASTTHIVGLSKPESYRLLQHLFAQLKIPEYQVRIYWHRPHSIALYDAAALQYFHIENFDPALNRYSERIEIAGTRPYR